MTKTYRSAILALIIAIPLFGSLTACTTTNPYTGEQQVSKTTIGAGLGAAAGAVTGAIIGNGRGALIGAGIGAAAGGLIGNYMDRQAADLHRELRASGVRVERRSNGDIRLIMPSNITFNINSTHIRPSFYRTLNSVAIVLRKYNKTVVKVQGFTDNTGPAHYNQLLSERRARSVAKYLMAHKISARRLVVTGYGTRHPIATNSTAAGRAENRRVEINIHQL